MSPHIMIDTTFEATYYKILNYACLLPCRVTTYINGREVEARPAGEWRPVYHFIRVGGRDGVGVTTISLCSGLNESRDAARRVSTGFLRKVRETIILARLNNGDVHMLGDADRGAEIGDNVEASSGKAVTDNNGATLSFVYDTPTAQIYTGDMDALIGQSTNLDEDDDDNETT